MDRNCLTSEVSEALIDTASNYLLPQVGLMFVLWLTIIKILLLFHPPEAIKLLSVTPLVFSWCCLVSACLSVTGVSVLALCLLVHQWSVVWLLPSLVCVCISSAFSTHLSLCWLAVW